MIAMILPLVALLGLAQAQSTAELIPRELLFGNPERTTVKLSPDGEQLSFLAPLNGVLNLFVAPATAPDAARAITNDTGRGVHLYTWTLDSAYLLYLKDEDGDENWHVNRVSPAGGDVTDLTPLDGIQAQLLAASPARPGEVVIGLNDRVPQFHDLYRLDIATGERELLFENNEGFLSYVFDDDLELRFGVVGTQDGGAEVRQRTKEGWETLFEIPMEDMLTTSPVSLNRAADTLYLLDSRGRDTAALVARDLASGEVRVLYANEQADVNDALVNPLTSEVEAAAATYLRTEWEVIDEAVADDLAYLRTVADGEFKVTSRSLDDRRWLVAYTLDASPVRYYLHERTSSEASFLFTARPNLEAFDLAEMHAVTIRARDGLELVSYYSLPVGSDAEGNGLPEKPLPLVLYVHGGPWARDSWGYNAVHQLLANRGYAVLSVNFRSSTGFGKAFLNAGNLEWGAAMQDDLSDAVAWAVEQGIADPERVAIMGGSYGGYAVLTGLTQTPDLFVAGVDIVGPSNLITMLEAFPTYWQPLAEVFATRIGDHRTEEGRAFLLERSPISHLDSLAAPLLIAQGANDPRVNQAESDRIVEALEKKDIPVTYLLYPDEGHGFVRPENNLSFMAATEAFLAQYLGGRVEPASSALEGSSVQVLEGAEHVPGFSDVVREESGG